MALNFVTFNQDHSSLAIGTTRGFRLYSTDPFNKTFETSDGDINLLEMLFSTSLVALILSPRLLRIQNTKRQSTICELTFPTRILSIKMNRKRLVVVLEDQIYVYDISNMNMLHTIETSPNPNAICALSPSSDNNYLAYPLPQKSAPSAYSPPSHAPPTGNHVAPTSGEVMIFDATKMEAVNVVQAHQTPLSCITVNSEGTLLATASEKGTIIRVFSIPDAQKLFQFRRGSIPSRIYSMSFNSTSTLLCVSSSTETIHIFRLVAANKRNSANSAMSDSHHRHSSATSIDRGSSPGSEAADESTEFGGSISNVNASDKRVANSTFAGMFRRTSQNFSKSFVASVGGYLPNAVAEMWEPQRDFIWVKVPRSHLSSTSGPIRTVVALSNNGPQLMVVTSEGNFLVFNVDLEKGGEGALVKQISILETNDKLGRSFSDE